MTNLYSVTYNTNNSTGGTTPATQTAETNSPTYSFATPQQNDLVRYGFTFAGWSESPNASSADYTPGATITLSQVAPSRMLYAVWLPALESLANMQEMTNTICQNSLENDTKQLIDTRDNKAYWVTKLKRRQLLDDPELRL